MSQDNSEQGSAGGANDDAGSPPSRSQGADRIETHIPALRLFARSLCGNAADADDLVQETLVRAIENIQSYKRGTHMRAWLFTIMRNRFYTNWTKRDRERTGAADCVSSVPTSAATQIWHVRRLEMEREINALPLHYREAIILVAVLGESYQYAAEILDCDIGTIKSRVNRARTALHKALGTTLDG